MKCREIIEKLNQLAPEHIACGWDNPGLLAGRRDKAVKRILAAVDADSHLELMSELAGILMEEENVDRLAASKTSREFWELLQEMREEE